MTIYRKGEIYAIYGGKTFLERESDEATRPAVIVSAKENYDGEEGALVVFLSTQEQTKRPEHVLIESAPEVSTAICERVTFARKRKIGRCMGQITEAEQRAIDEALKTVFAIGGGRNTTGDRRGEAAGRSNRQSIL